MNAAAVQRYARQIALSEVGPDGQERLLGARVAVVGGDLTAQVAAHYLAAAGVGRLRWLGGGAADGDDDLRASNPDVAIEHLPLPADGEGDAWVAALDGVDAVVRSGFDDDPMLRAAVRRGVPVVVVRGRDEGVELVSFRRNGPCPHAPLEVPSQRSAPASDRAAAVVAGTLAATEALHTLLGIGGDAPARHLSLPLDGRPPRAQEIPWSPACFACGGHGSEMSFDQPG
ncbi:MAG TPA: ThiF family adenylyltransferase [Polyangia bacterium]|nr:ThiF family adenylyltransferase [Polyangia bacterium]